MIQLGKLHFRGEVIVLPEMDRIRVFADSGQVIAEWTYIGYGVYWCPIIITGDVSMDFIQRCMDHANDKRNLNL